MLEAVEPVDQQRQALDDGGDEDRDQGDGEDHLEQPALAHRALAAGLFELLVLVHLVDADEHRKDQNDQAEEPGQGQGHLEETAHLWCLRGEPLGLHRLRIGPPAGVLGGRVSRLAAAGRLLLGLGRRRLRFGGGMLGGVEALVDRLPFDQLVVVPPDQTDRRHQQDRQQHQEVDQDAA